MKMIRNLFFRASVRSGELHTSNLYTVSNFSTENINFLET